MRPDLLTSMEVVDELSTLVPRQVGVSRGRVVDVREKRELPEPWAAWLLRAGIVAPNVKTPRPSLNALGAKIGVHPSTLGEMVHGTRHTNEDTIEAVAKALGVDVLEVSRATDRARTVREPYAPPAEVHSLSRDVQDAISDLIRALAKESDGRGNAASKISAGRAPATPRVSDTQATSRRTPLRGSTPTPTDAPLRPGQP